MAKKSKNYTLSLPLELMDKVKHYAEIPDGPSINNMVKEAIEQYVLKLDKAWIESQMKKAVSDLLFMEDLNACMNDFKTADYEANPKATKK